MASTTTTTTTTKSGEPERALPNFYQMPGSATVFLEEAKVDVHAITIINTFVLKSSNEAELFLENWQRDSDFMRKQYGMLSTQLHRALGEASNMFVNVTQWESTKAFREAFHNPEFQMHLKNFPAGTHVYPVLLKKIAMPNACTA
ncbi:antibiotic biosynthesis monooxygenase [Cadophora sp. MPI-SDFR-AT-0126]|nr:antibiotic biosynthesis monooxygenase [Leotiomycetes sp. MPI-SDFR-AT-0126]